MNLPLLAWRNLWYKPLPTLLSVLLLALGVGLMGLVMQTSRQLEQGFRRNLRVADAVVGAKGSPLQLILSAMLHIDAPTGNIPLREARRLMRHPMVRRGIPLSYGDSYEGLRIVGTDTAYIGLYGGRLQAGALWTEPMQVVAGAEAARRSGLKPGSRFEGGHGLAEGAEAHHDQPYTVVGVLEPGGTVLDHLLLCSIESVWQVHEHDAPLPDSAREVTALLLKFKGPRGMVELPRMLESSTALMAATPALEINRLYERLGIGFSALKAIALLILVVSGLSVFISLYSALRERRYELSLLRALGAGRMRVLGLLLWEGLLQAAAGALAGLLISRAALWLLQETASRYYTPLNPWDFQPGELWLLLAVLGIGLLAALGPALQAYRLNIHRSLSDG